VGGINAGTLLPGIVGAAMAVVGFIKLFIIPNSHIIRTKWLRKTLLGLFAAWFISFILIEGLIIYSGRPEQAKPADYLVVLGAGLHGETMSLSLQYRMNKSLDYLKLYPDTKVIVSGGQGAGEKISEAEAMKRFLVKNGIDEKRILNEDKSLNTMQNFKYSRQVILNNGGSPQSRIEIITNGFHMLRSRLLADRNGFIFSTYPCSTPPSVLINCYLREYLAVIKSFFLDR
ncbi:MAG: YdcF family protein, partial [Bacillota bacterium]|nr:YdcF family protein [Bacillota bacterium]